jgi:twitching motility protein PilT
MAKIATRVRFDHCARHGRHRRDRAERAEELRQIGAAHDAIREYPSSDTSYTRGVARIDRILSIVAEQGANELRVGTDREPKMLAYGSAKRLSLPLTSEEMLRDLLGDILTPEREASMRERGRVELAYTAGELGTFQVTLTHRTDGFDATFRRSSARAASASASASVPIAAPPAEPSTPFESALTESTASVPTLPIVPAALAQGDAPAPSARHLGVAEDVVVTGQLAELLAHAAARRASDLHLSDREAPVLRIDGKLQRLGQGALPLAELLPFGPVTAARFARAASIDLGLEVSTVGRVRAHVFRTSEGTAAVIRLLPPAAPSLSSLNLPVSLADLVDLPHGLVLVSGSAGSGKSTTLAALAQEALRRRSVVLATLEDPIEYQLAPEETSVLRRRQVGRDVPDFANGLRDVLRQDPNIILIGEMRDVETTTLALTAAETGHLVFASVHSRSAASTIERIVDIYPPERESQIRVQLADALRAVIAQRLVPRARGGGRVPAIEVMRTSHAVAALIREGKTAQIPSAIQSGRADGMITLERCLADRVIAGEIRLEDARAAANDGAVLEMNLPKR